MTVVFADPGAYNRALADELDAAFCGVVSSGRYVLGAELDGFEREFAAYVEADHCVGVGSGLDALALGLRALGVMPGDEVLVPTNTFVATWLAVSAVGAVPVGVEPDASTHLLDPSRLEDALTSRTRVVVPVHLYGQPVEMDRVCAWAAGHGLAVVADAAEANGARYQGRGLGGIGTAVAWSFYPTKNLGALGDSGAITTDDPEIADRVRRFRNYGSLTPGSSEVLGANSRLDELQAALLRIKLRCLEDWNARRTAQAERYLEALGGHEVGLPTVGPLATPAWHLFVVRVGDRDAVRADLVKAGVETLVHYQVPPFAQPAYSHLTMGANSFPLARRLAAEVLSLPLGLHLSDADQDRVVDVLLRSLERRARPEGSRRRIA